MDPEPIGPSLLDGLYHHTLGTVPLDHLASEKRKCNCIEILVMRKATIIAS
jgi:hypothetical protein